jgi:enoyl-[acyl-carrier-protein] reductase (NADH)
MPAYCRNYIGTSGIRLPVVPQRCLATARQSAHPREIQQALDAGKGNSSQVADTCLFLASDMSRHVSGVEIFIDAAHHCSFIMPGHR